MEGKQFLPVFPILHYTTAEASAIETLAHCLHNNGIPSNSKQNKKSLASSQSGYPNVVPKLDLVAYS